MGVKGRRKTQNVERGRMETRPRIHRAERDSTTVVEALGEVARFVVRSMGGNGFVEALWEIYNSIAIR